MIPRLLSTIVLTCPALAFDRLPLPGGDFAKQGVLLCEYHLARGDESVLPWIEEAVEWLPTTTHRCKWGMQAFGHGPDGLPYDDKAPMAPTAHLLVFDALARRRGVESRIWEHVREYVLHSWSDPDAGGHGAMGYNASYKDLGEFWSRSGLDHPGPPPCAASPAPCASACA